MQYPEIQFYRGSMVRLATGHVKPVEALSSNDFIESARLAVSSPTCKQAPTGNRNGQQKPLSFPNRLPPDENNNSVFNSPEPASSFDDSPRMKTDDEDEEIDVELDVVSTNDDDKNDLFQQRLHGYNSNDNSHHHYQHQHQYNQHHQYPQHQHHHPNNQIHSQHQGLNLTSRNHQTSNLQQVKLEQLGSSSSAKTSSTTTAFNVSSLTRMDDETSPGGGGGQAESDSQDFYIDYSQVRDILEVGPIHQQQLASSQRLPASTSPASSTNSLNNQEQHYSSLPSTSSSSSSNSLQSSISPPAVMPQILSTASPTSSQTVLVKFFLKTSQSVVFIEVPTEHPFFDLNNGWSSWNPQRTYDKFGLICRKLKVGDTCISLIRRKQNNPKQQQQQDSDHCNDLFSSIKINE